MSHLQDSIDLRKNGEGMSYFYIIILLKSFICVRIGFIHNLRIIYH